MTEYKTVEEVDRKRLVTKIIEIIDTLDIYFYGQFRTFGLISRSGELAEFDIELMKIKTKLLNELKNNLTIKNPNFEKLKEMIKTMNSNYSNSNYHWQSGNIEIKENLINDLLKEYYAI